MIKMNRMMMIMKMIMNNNNIIIMTIIFLYLIFSFKNQDSLNKISFTK